jgi:hypothetical protein
LKIMANEPNASDVICRDSNASMAKFRMAPVSLKARAVALPAMTSLERSLEPSRAIVSRSRGKGSSFND